MSKLLLSSILVSIGVFVLLSPCLAKDPIPTMLKYEAAGNQLALDISIKNLKKEAPYVLCLNGKEGQDGNDLLKKFGKWGNQGKYDFKTVYSSSEGVLSYKDKIELPEGRYDVTFVVKDKNNDYKPVFSEDHWRFTISRR